MPKVSLGACIIARNEEKNLGRCLQSLQGIVDEIVVLDTGSSDRTMEIARSYGARCAIMEWSEDFSTARNRSLELSTADWVLWIDADEELAGLEPDVLQSALSNSRTGGWLATLENVMDDEGAILTHSSVRLFRRTPATSFEGRIHEQVVPSLVAQGLEIDRLHGFVIRHYGYGPHATAHKATRAVRMLRSEIEREPANAFHWYNLANAFLFAGEHADAERAARGALVLLEDQDTMPAGFDDRKARHALIQALAAQGKHATTLAACQVLRQQEKQDVVTEFFRSQSLLRLDRLDEALEAVQSCCQFDWDSDIVGDRGIATHKRWVLLGQVLVRLGRPEQALEPLSIALRSAPRYPDALFAKGLSLASLGRVEEALVVLSGCFDSDGFGVDSLRIAANLHLSAGRGDEASELLQRLWNLGVRDEDLFVQWVHVCERIGDPEKVAHAYSAYMQSSDQNPNMLIEWGRAFAANGDSQRALNCFVESIQRNPSEPNGYFNCADLLLTLGEFADAAHLYESGLRLRPDHAPGWFVMGNCLAKLGLTQAAIASYTEALAVDPGFEDARHNLSLMAA